MYYCIIIMKSDYQSKYIGAENINFVQWKISIIIATVNNFFKVCMG